MTPNQLLTRLPILVAQKQAGNNSQKLNNEIRQIIYSLCMYKHFYNQLIKNNVEPIDQQYIKMNNIFMSTENSKTNYLNRFRLYFTNKINLRRNKKIVLRDLSILYTWYNIKEENNNNKFRLSGPT